MAWRDLAARSAEVASVVRRGALRDADPASICRHKRKVKAKAAKLCSQLGEEAATTIMTWAQKWAAAADDGNTDTLIALAGSAPDRAGKVGGSHEEAQALRISRGPIRRQPAEL